MNCGYSKMVLQGEKANGPKEIHDTGILELFVLIMDTTAWLSQEKRTCLLRHEGHHTAQAK